MLRGQRSRQRLRLGVSADAGDDTRAQELHPAPVRGAGVSGAAGTGAYLDTSRHQGLSACSDTLHCIGAPGLPADIRQFNNPTSIVRRTAAVLSSVQPSKPWNTRLTVGLWSASFLPFSQEYLPDLPIVLISPSIRYARQFLSVPNIAFSVNQKLLMGPLGRGFLDEARARERAVYVWTVNEHNLINWCLRAGVDGIITDAVETCREKAEDWDGKEQEAIRLGQRVRVWIWSLVFVLLGWILEWKYLTPVKRVQS